MICYSGQLVEVNLCLCVRKLISESFKVIPYVKSVLLLANAF